MWHWKLSAHKSSGIANRARHIVDGAMNGFVMASITADRNLFEDHTHKHMHRRGFPDRKSVPVANLPLPELAAGVRAYLEDLRRYSKPLDVRMFESLLENADKLTLGLAARTTDKKEE